VRSLAILLAVLLVQLVSARGGVVRKPATDSVNCVRSGDSLGVSCFKRNGWKWPDS
jgi:hypothetical protein